MYWYVLESVVFYNVPLNTVMYCYILLLEYAAALPTTTSVRILLEAVMQLMWLIKVRRKGAGMTGASSASFLLLVNKTGNFTIGDPLGMRGRSIHCRFVEDGRLTNEFPAPSNNGFRNNNILNSYKGALLPVTSVLKLNNLSCVVHVSCWPAEPTFHKLDSMWFCSVRPKRYLLRTRHASFNELVSINYVSGYLNRHLRLLQVLRCNLFSILLPPYNVGPVSSRYRWPMRQL